MSILSAKKITFIGGGNMANAIIDGLLKLKQDKGLDFQIAVSDRNEPKRVSFVAKGVQAVSPDDVNEVVSDADVVVLSVKPQGMQGVCQELIPHLSGQLVLSVAAGLTVDTLCAWLGGHQRVVRSMPNLPSAIGLGATGMYAKADVSESDKAVADAIMSASGLVAWLDDEALMHAVTAAAGSAPAYFFYILEHMIDKAVELGLGTDDAKALVIQSLIGAGELARHNDPKTLREQVTSKGGTTAAALAVFGERDVGEVIRAGMQACVDRSIELGKPSA
ncbi:MULTISPECIES: pyrroline-5-carboxylate reductase [unclassified Moraxella]|uniref:pyrroline-5-carboxylate reductase n=1 Tax=unclassified Moraxella TaxID=2685852 RepID=UPI00359D5205